MLTLRELVIYLGLDIKQFIIFQTESSFYELINILLHKNIDKEKILFEIDKLIKIVELEININNYNYKIKFNEQYKYERTGESAIIQIIALKQLKSDVESFVKKELIKKELIKKEFFLNSTEDITVFIKQALLGNYYIYFSNEIIESFKKLENKSIHDNNDVTFLSSLIDYREWLQIESHKIDKSKFLANYKDSKILDFRIFGEKLHNKFIVSIIDIINEE